MKLEKLDTESFEVEKFFTRIDQTLSSHCQKCWVAQISTDPSVHSYLLTYYVLGYGWQKFRWYFVHIWPLLFHKKAILSLPFDTIRGDNRTWKDTRLHQENYTSFAKIPKYLYSIVSIFEHPVQQGKYIYELFSNVSTIYFYLVQNNKM